MDIYWNLIAWKMIFLSKRHFYTGQTDNKQIHLKHSVMSTFNKTNVNRWILQVWSLRKICISPVLCFYLKKLSGLFCTSGMCV